LTLNSDGSFAYTPNANFVGVDSFTYYANDGMTNSTNPATVLIDVTNSAPISTDDNYTIRANTSLGITLPGVLNNDTDVEGNPLTASLVNSTSNGLLTLNSDGSFAYTPNANFVGVDSFTYRANDGMVNSTNPATVLIQVTNSAPIAANDNYTANRNGVLDIVPTAGVLSNDSDPEGSSLSAAIATNPSNGTVTLNTDGSFSYQPRAGFAGTDSFTYRASDGITSSTATVTIDVLAGANTAPIANPDTFTAVIGSTLSVSAAAGVLANDADAENDPLVVSVVNTTNNGTLNLNANGSFTYHSNAGFSGVDSFTYQANDGVANSNLVTVTLSVVPNTPPVANNDTYTAAANNVFSVDILSGVLNNDTDAEGTALAVSAVTQPSNGTVTLNSDGSFIYIPNAGFIGTDSFTYQANDGLANSAIATVTLIVTTNTPPFANNDSFLIPSNTTLSISPVSGVLNNDTDAESNPLTASLLNTTGHGTLTLNPNGSFTYVPNAGFTGTDSFTYRANDGISNSNTATVSISVFLNTPPIANNDLYTTVINRPLIVPGTGILGNDTDAEGNSLSATPVGLPIHGNLLFSPGGSFTYTPNAGFTGTDSFTYRANDGFVNSNNLGTVLITVTPNTPPIANPDTYSINRNLTLSTTVSVLSNDTDAQNDPLTAALGNSTSHGTLQFNSDGTFVYAPNAGFTGMDSFTYRASDGLANSAPTTVTISVNAASSPPTANNDPSYSTTPNNPLVVAASLGVLANDTDPENDPLVAIQQTGPVHGTLGLSTNGSFTYTPDAGFIGTDSFTYQASDGINTSNLATVSIAIGGANQAPMISLPGSQVVFRNTDLTIATGLTVSDPDAGSSLMAVSLSVTSGILTLGSTSNLTNLTGNGSTTISFQGSFSDINAALTNLVYQPTPGFIGSDSITITVDDQGNTGSGGNQVTSGTIAINVTAGPSLVRDLNALQTTITIGTVVTTESSSPSSMTAVGNTLYFVATDGLNGVELWRSDGTDGGTSQVADINPGAGNSSPSNLTVVGNTLFFSATDGVRGMELWQTDLTTGATSLVKDIRTSSASSNPTNLLNFNGTLFFRANDGSGQAIWRSDGTSSGTQKVGSGYVQPGNLTIVGNTLYFTANNGAELWKTDGTSGGTVLVKSVGVAAGISNLTAIGNTLFFTATDSQGRELWRSNGTTTGTVRTADILSGTGSSSPTNLVNLNGTLYFFANDGTGFGLWKSTAAGVVSKVQNQNLPSAGQPPASLTVVGSTLFFVVDVGTSTTNQQLWKSDGSSFGLVSNINSTGNAAPTSLTNVNGVLFFVANDGNTRIWRSDGTSAGTMALSGNFTSPTPTNLTAVGNRLYFTADSGTSGVELWVL
jgi:ELWxxDGT repeat protein/VCBS repeat-containing protein